MKKWSIKKKTIKDEIASNAPKPEKDRSIKHIFKMNFLPITFFLYFIIIVSLVFLFVAENPGSVNVPANNSGDSNVWTAKELSEDLDQGGTTTSISLKYKSLNDKDEIFIEDTIHSISYDSNLEVTIIEFDFPVGYIDNLMFEGDITDFYQIGDKVQIPVTIQSVAFTLEPPDVLTEFTYKLELFENQWESEEYFVDHLDTSLKGLKPLDQSFISFL